MSLRGVDELVRRLATCQEEQLLDLVEQYAQQTRIGRPDPLVAAAVEAIEADPNARIGEIADRLGVSYRSLISRFQAETGTSPKRHAQVLRFHRLLDAVSSPGGSSGWAQLAAASGYYDQPHVIRAFHRFSGWTPAEYARMIDEHGLDAAHFVPLEHVPASARP
jgi:transcriptional regulator GlxA family with amidase domain